MIDATTFARQVQNEGVKGRAIFRLIRDTSGVTATPDLANRDRVLTAGLPENGAQMGPISDIELAPRLVSA